MNNLVTRKKRGGLLAAVLSLALTFSEFLPALAQGEPAATYEEYVSGEYREEVDAGQYEIVRIATVEQLRELADACTYDAWSRDKRVLLTADLDLNGTELELPVFGGIFDGKGHTISGLEIQREGSQTGLFRYLQQGAVIQELSVSGARVLPQGSGCQVGILVGRNYGSIVNCQVSGVLEGEAEVGGIAGVNEESGVIRSCTAEVTVLGNRRSGGIVGSNHGTLNNCANRGNINIYTNDIVYELEDFTVENLEKAPSGAQLDAHMDTGGIAGISDGKIYFCSNAGTVGYAHVGYNTGGIVGRLHQGYIQNCTNTGHVLGRKDVGGIVGQMEPFMEVEYIDGKLDELDREMDIFLDMLEVSHDHLSAYGDQTMTITRQLNANLRNVSVSAANLLNITNDLWHVYNQELSGISGDFDRLSNDLKAISDREKEDEKRQESEVGGESQEGEIQEEELQDGEQSGEPAAVEAGGQEQDRQELGDQLGDQLEDWREELDSVSGGNHIDWNRPGEGDNPEDSKNPLDWEKPQYTQEYRDALSNFAHSTSGHLHKVTDTTSQQSGQVSHNLEAFNLELKAAMDHLTELTDTLDAAQGVVDADVDALIAQARKLRRMFSEIRDELFGYEGITVNDTSDETASESIENAGAGELQQELLQEGDTVTEKWYDTASFQQGKITLCLNRGLIEADTSVGGIVGQIAIEHDLDPEDDITFTGPESLSIQESIKAVVRESRNEGRIVAKRNYVGGIAGKADFGAIVSCESYADIQSTGGDYVGGIAGRSDYTIRSCFSTGFLGGKSYGGGAIPMDYEDFAAREGLPEEFALLTLRFVVLDEEGELREEVETLQIPYGSGLAEEKLPKLPEKEGYYGQWPEIDYSHITESRVLAAEYTKWITALAAEEPDTAQGQAAILVEGLFYPEDVLEVTRNGEGPYCLQIHTAEGLYDRPVSVRLHQSLLPGHYEIRVLQGAGETVAESKIMGSYVVFGMEQPGSFLIVEISPEIPAQYFVLGGSAAALVLILVIRSLLRRRKAKRAGKDVGQNVGATVESRAAIQSESAVQTEKHML